MKLSRYTHLAEFDESVLLVSMLSHSVLRLSHKATSFVRSIEPGTHTSELPVDRRELLKTLIAGLFVVPDDFDEWEFIRRLHKQERESKDVLNLVIAPTLECNMRCHYCFQSHKKDGLTDNIEQTIAQLVQKRIVGYKHLHVQWFGGEPLLAMDHIRHLSKTLSDISINNNVSYGAEIITNGYNLTPLVIKELIELGVSEMQVTFEGSKTLHDKVRKTKKNTGTYDKIIENSLVAAVEMKVTARIHVAPYGFDSALELIDDLAERGLNKKLERIYFSPLFNYQPGKRNDIFQINDKKFISVEDFARYQIPLIKKAKSLGFNIGDFLGGSYGLCMAMQRGALMVSPTGELAKCYLDVGEDAHQVGTTKSGLINKKLVLWEDYDFSLDKECSECSFAPVCLGGCPKQQMNKADKKVICTPLKYNFKERVAIQYDADEGSR